MKFVCVLISVSLCVTTAQAQQELKASLPNLPHYTTGPTWFPSVDRPAVHAQ